MKTLALVSCGKSKRDTTSKAKDMYTGDLFGKTRAYVEREYDAWFILSALYGAMLPEREIPPYDYTLIGKPRAQLEKWSEEVAQVITSQHSADTEIHIFAGREYRKYLQPLLEGKGYTVKVPMSGLGIGQQKQWLKRRLDA